MNGYMYGFRKEFIEKISTGIDRQRDMVLLRGTFSGGGRKEEDWFGLGPHLSSSGLLFPIKRYLLWPVFKDLLEVRLSYYHSP